MCGSGVDCERPCRGLGRPQANFQDPCLVGGVIVSIPVKGSAARLGGDVLVSILVKDWVAPGSS